MAEAAIIMLATKLICSIIQLAFYHATFTNLTAPYTLTLP